MAEQRPTNPDAETPPGGNAPAPLDRQERPVQDLKQATQWRPVTLSSIGDGVIATDPHGKVTMLNPVAQALTGWTQEEAVGRSLTEVFRIVNQDTRAEVQNPALRDGPIVVLVDNSVLIARDATERSIDASSTPIRSDTGEAAGALMVFRDIGQRERSAKKLRGKEDVVRLFIEHAPALIAQFDRQMRYICASGRWKQHYGLTGDITGRSHYELFPELPEAWKAVHRRTLAGEAMRSEGDRFERADGRVQWVKWETLPWRDATGQIGGILIAAEDITERKRTEEGLARLAAIVAFSVDAIVGKDLNGVITSWNNGAERLFGYAAEEVVGKPVELLIPADHRHEESGILDRIGRGERVEPFETVRQRKDGSRVDVWLTISPVKDAQGRIIGAAKIARDITERKQTESALRASEERLALSQEVAHVGTSIGTSKPA